MLTKVDLYTDGASRGNPGPGGFGAILVFVTNNGVKAEKEITEGYKNTTNNRMELMGAIVGLEALNRPCDVEIFSDSQYVIKAFNDKWIEGWIKKGWKTAGNKPVKNVELWKRLLKAAEPHGIRWNWVKGHAGHEENERCDTLATRAADRPVSELLHDDGGDLS